MESIIKKKKKKLFSPEQEDDTITALKSKTKSEVYNNLFKVMKYHIGKDNSISRYDLFVNIYGLNPEAFDIFKRDYLWNIIKLQLKEARRNNSLFTILRGNEIFVLKTEEERKLFHKAVDLHISGLENLQDKAKQWVLNQKWKNL